MGSVAQVRLAAPSISVEVGRSLTVPGGGRVLGNQGTRKRAGEIRPLSALAVPTASEAATVEAATVEAATVEAVTVEAAKTSYMGDAHTVRETATGSSTLGRDRTPAICFADTRSAGSSV